MGIDVQTNYSMGKAEYEFFTSKLLPIHMGQSMCQCGSFTEKFIMICQTAGKINIRNRRKGWSHKVLS